MVAWRVGSGLNIAAAVLGTASSVAFVVWLVMALTLGGFGF